MLKERRTLTTDVTFRSLGDESTDAVAIEGYALKFNTQSERMWDVVETLDPHCLDSTDMSNVVALYNHDDNYPLARSTVSSGAGSLSLTVDDVGLKFSLIPTDTSFAKDLMANMQAGVVNQCSFAFSLAQNGSKWAYDADDDTYYRTVVAIEKLYDVSVVTYPAYSDTEANVTTKRAFDDAKQALADERKACADEIRKRKLAIEIDCFGV